MGSVALAKVIAGQAVGALRNPAFRRSLALSLRSAVGGSTIFQPYNDTAEDRYPEIFRFAATADPRQVLSFGCSYGAELTTLRSYLPSARITGVDASRGNVRQARERVAGDPRIVVHRASNTRRLPSEQFDLITAMAVFRHGALGESRPETCTPFLRFDHFEAAVADLVRTLRVGGLLAVEHANFAVEDTRSAAELRCVLKRSLHDEEERTPQYGRDNRRAAPKQYRGLIFERIAPA